MASSAVFLIDNASHVAKRVYCGIGGKWQEIRQGFARVNNRWVKIFDNGYIPPPPPPPTPLPDAPNYLMIADGYVYTSSDGKEFTQGERLFSPGTRYKIVSDGKYYYVCELETGTPNAKRTITGEEWEEIPNFPDVVVSDFVYEAGVFVVAADTDSKIYYTEDAMSLWSTAGTSATTDMPKIVYLKDTKTWYVFNELRGMEDTNAWRFKFPAPTLYPIVLPQGVMGLAPSVVYYDKYTYIMGRYAAAPTPSGHINRSDCIVRTIDNITFFLDGSMATDGSRTVATNGNNLITSLTLNKNAFSLRTVRENKVEYVLYSTPTLDFSTTNSGLNGRPYNMQILGFLNGMFVGISDRQDTLHTDASDMAVGAYSVDGTVWSESAMIAHNSVLWHKKVGNLYVVLSYDGVMQATADGRTWYSVSTGAVDANIGSKIGVSNVDD